MKKNILLWVLAFVITLGLAAYQRLTGPTHPMSGEININGEQIKYSFDRSHAGSTDHIVRLKVDPDKYAAVLCWKRFKTSDSWTEINMVEDKGELIAAMPNQPHAGKLEYFIRIYAGFEIKTIPEQPVVIRFRGEVPTLIMIFHIITIFAAMLLSTRTGLEIFNKEPKLKSYTIWTIVTLFVGGLILGPVVQYYAFDAFWTGWPFGHDLTDNKTFAAFIGWVIAFFMMKKSKNPKGWIIFAALLMLVVYLIPHSVLGSELDYEKIDKQAKPNKVSNDLPGISYMNSPDIHVGDQFYEKDSGFSPNSISNVAKANRFFQLIPRPKGRGYLI
ncbi:MAG: hypothetical protein V1720_01400 [bacterium]